MNIRNMIFVARWCWCLVLLTTKMVMLHCQPVQPLGTYIFVSIAPRQLNLWAFLSFPAFLSFHHLFCLFPSGSVFFHDFLLLYFFGVFAFFDVFVSFFLLCLLLDDVNKLLNNSIYTVLSFCHPTSKQFWFIFVEHKIFPKSQC